MYKAYKDHPRVQVMLVYVNEAHPQGRGVRASAGGDARGEPTGVGSHRSMDDRVLAASACMEGLKLTLPIVLDTMDGVTEKAYRGRPAATVVVGLDGTVLLHTTGPGGARPRQAEAMIKKLLADMPITQPATQPTTRPSAQPTSIPATQPARQR